MLGLAFDQDKASNGETFQQDEVRRLGSQYYIRPDFFFDTEFTGLHGNARLISLGICLPGIPETFYAEFNDFGIVPESDHEWLRDNVFANCRFVSIDDGQHNNWINRSGTPHLVRVDDEINSVVVGDSYFVSGQLTTWLRERIARDKVVAGSDCLAWDWYLFITQLFGHSFNAPEWLSYIPLDLCTLMAANNVDPDVNREEFGEMVDDNAPKHNSLWDAKVIRSCWQKITAK